MARIRGKVTKLLKHQGYGFVYGSDGCTAFFDQSSLRDIDIHTLSVGQKLEYDIQFGARAQAVNISRAGAVQKAG